MGSHVLIWIMVKFFSVFLGFVLVLAGIIEIYNKFIKKDDKHKK